MTGNGAPIGSYAKSLNFTGEDVNLRQPAIELADFNQSRTYPFNLRIKDFEMAMQDVYDFFHDVNKLLIGKGLERLEEATRPAILSGLLSDMLTASLGKHSRSLIPNEYFNGHPDLLVKGAYPKNSIKAGTEGIEIKTTLKRGGAVDTHGGRNQWMCVFVYDVDIDESRSASQRLPLTFREVYLSEVTIDDFRKNARGELGTRTATLHKAGIQKLRKNWVYLNKASEGCPPGE